MFGQRLSCLVAVVLTVTVFWFDSTDACRCLPLPEPKFCQTKFLALVEIIDVQINETYHKKWYTFDLIEDLTPAENIPHLNRNTHRISTSSSSASCGVDLNTGSRYLLGGSFTDYDRQPFISLCNSYVEHWQDSRNLHELSKYKETCASIKN